MFEFGFRGVGGVEVFLGLGFRHVGLADDVLDRISRFKYEKAHVKQIIHNKLIEHKQYIHKHGDDIPEIRDWKWGNSSAPQETHAETKPTAGAEETVRSGAPS